MPWSPCPLGGGIETAPVVGHLEPELCRSVAEPDRAVVASAYFATFWRASRQEKYTAASISGAYRPIPSDSTRDRDRGLSRLPFQRRDEALVGEQRRVDPAREVAQVLDRFAGLGLRSSSIADRLRRIPRDETFREPAA